MKLIKTTFFSGFATLIRIGTGFISNKIIAIITGPIGVSTIGQFMNFLAIVFNFANGAINTGVVKYTAEYEGDEHKLKNLYVTSLKLSIYFSLITGTIIFLFSNNISYLLFNQSIYSNPIKILGTTLLFYSINSLLISIINGKKNIKLFTILNIVTSIISLFITIALVYYYKTSGAIYSLVLSQTLVFFISLAFIFKSKSKWLSWRLLLIPVEKNIKNKLYRFSLMSITSSIILPLSQIFIRTLIIKKFGDNAAGYWQSTMRISDGYLLLITTSLSTYYLPKLSSIHNNDIELKKEILNGYKIILPFVFFSSLLIYIFRLQIIHLLFSNQFDPVSDLLGWQFIGDFFKISSWLLAFLMLAKAMTKTYIITEIIFTTSYILLVEVISNYYNLKGVSIAFAINYFLYFITMIILFRNILFKKRLQNI